MEKWHGQGMTAKVLENRLEKLIKRHPHLQDLRRRSMHCGDLPEGFAAYVIDMVENMLEWFVGEDNVNKRKTVARQTRKHRFML